MPDGTMTIKKGRKFAQVVDGARSVFMANGFEGASVDEIARVANVSKATLYSYFPDKKLLFMEVVSAECHRQAELGLSEADSEAAIKDTLDDVAERFIAFLTSEFGKQVFRICVAEADRFPELGQAFYENGPMLFRHHMIDLLKAAQEKGEVDIEDFELASDQFGELCKADLFPRMVFSVSPSFSDAEKTRIAKGAVSTFLARYGSA